MIENPCFSILYPDWIAMGPAFFPMATLTTPAAQVHRDLPRRKAPHLSEWCPCTPGILWQGPRLRHGTWKELREKKDAFHRMSQLNVIFKMTIASGSQMQNWDLQAHVFQYFHVDVRTSVHVVQIYGHQFAETILLCIRTKTPSITAC